MKVNDGNLVDLTRLMEDKYREVAGFHNADAARKQIECISGSEDLVVKVAYNEDNEPIGYAIGHRNLPRTSSEEKALKDIGERVFEFLTVYVAPGYRGKDIGTRLVKDVIDEAREKGFEHLAFFDDVGDPNTDPFTLKVRRAAEVQEPKHVNAHYTEGTDMCLYTARLR